MALYITPFDRPVIISHSLCDTIGKIQSLIGSYDICHQQCLDYCKYGFQLVVYIFKYTTFDTPINVNASQLLRFEVRGSVLVTDFTYFTVDRYLWLKYVSNNITCLDTLMIYRDTLHTYNFGLYDYIKNLTHIKREIKKCRKNLRICKKRAKRVRGMTYAFCPPVFLSYFVFQYS